jgi:enoyl-CoA hydratase/carnithine racemase
MPKGLDWVELCRASKPLVAAVNGAAVGIGMTMILPFDVIVASEKARFGMLFIKVGLVPELASTHYLVQRMGFGRASEMCLSGRLYPAAEALAGGLIERCTAPEALLETALEIARGIAANPDPQLRMIKDLLTRNGLKPISAPCSASRARSCGSAGRRRSTPKRSRRSSRSARRGSVRAAAGRSAACRSRTRRRRGFATA